MLFEMEVTIVGIVSGGYDLNASPRHRIVLGGEGLAVKEIEVMAAE